VGVGKAVGQPVGRPVGKEEGVGRTPIVLQLQVGLGPAGEAPGPAEESAGAGLRPNGRSNWRFEFDEELSLPTPALERTEERTRLAAMTLTLDSFFGMALRTDSSLPVRVPDWTRELGTQVRPSLDLQVDSSLELTAKVAPGELSESMGVLTWWKTLPSIKAFVSLPTSKA
jgi:hypothetical protein